MLGLQPMCLRGGTRVHLQRLRCSHLLQVLNESGMYPRVAQARRKVLMATWIVLLVMTRFAIRSRGPLRPHGMQACRMIRNVGADP